VINNVVGFFGKVEPIDVFKITLRKGDVLLLCSDGLSDVLNDHDIHKIVSKNNGSLLLIVLPHQYYRCLRPRITSLLCN
jgi:serine/threonine protein phosphatase PrpC